ncbi:MAG: hypothetical protein IJT73_05850 [Selenomonadaceae bacterium]|nr:hypothetical protein [Selenomonadaceae bacterium]
MLTDLIFGEDFFDKILIVESAEYISILAERFPDAEIFFITTDEDFFDERAKIFVMDYREEILPFDAEFFDLIIGDLTLEVVVNPQDIAAGFSRYIKQTGIFLTSFTNIRHWTILEKLMRGWFNGIVSRFYTRTNFERLMFASFYKDVKFSPVIKSAPPKLLEKLIECGFENYGDDLEVEIWQVRAARSIPELSLLKSMYTADFRAEFARILHRVEYDVETFDSVENFWRLYDAAGMFESYAAEFIRSVVIHRENFYKNLRENSSRLETEKIIAETENFYDL